MPRTSVAPEAQPVDGACGRAVWAHRVAAAIPGVEVADHAGPSRVRGPQCETHAVDAVHAARVCAEQALWACRGAVAEGGEAGLVELRPECERIRVVVFVCAVCAGGVPAYLQAVIEPLAATRNGGLEETGVDHVADAAFLQRGHAASGLRVQHLDGIRTGQQRAQL